MNVIDALIAIPLLWFTYKGFNKGLIIELATLIALLLGVYIAGQFSDYTANFLRESMNFDSKYMSIISFCITFLGVVLLVMLLGKSLEKVINVLLLGFVNKLMGGLFGLIKAAFVISIFIYILSTFGFEQKAVSHDLQNSSLLYKPVKSIAPTLFPIIKQSGINAEDAGEKILKKFN